MNLDDVLALASDRTLSELERARARRATRRVRQEYQRATSEGRDLTGDVEVRDPLTAGTDEAARIVRAAQLAKHGTVTWVRASGELTWSDEMALILGYPPGTVRHTLATLARLVHPDDVDGVRAAVESVWRDRTVREATCRVIRPDRVTRYVHCHLEYVVDPEDRPHGIVGTARDVTEVELARQEQTRLARRRETVHPELAGRDPVTGLFHRARFADEIDTAQRGGPGVLLVVAVEPVGPDADADGEPGGGPDEQERLAVAVAQVVRRVARRSDVCGLTAPNEFGVLMPRTTPSSATALAESIIDGIRSQPFVLGRTRLLDAWGGLVRYQGRDGSRGVDLVVDAETAWRRARATGVARVALDQPAAEEERRELCRHRVRATVAENRFTLYTQPILDLRLNQVTRQEILLRVLDDAGRAHSASTLLGDAERVDEVLPIDRWVVDRTIELVARGSGTSHYQVNLSGRSLGDPHLLERLQLRLQQYDVDPGQLTFEVTETARIGNLTEAHNFAHGIRELGCQLALDDFGSGHVPFTFLTCFPVDLVKLDGEFVTGIEHSVANQRIVRSIVELCGSLGIRTAAEHVEDEGTMNLLRDFGVDFAQGYLVGRPKPVGRPSGDAVARFGQPTRLPLRRMIVNLPPNDCLPSPFAWPGALSPE
ncbi:EAL domain-containing protein [Micromonospora sp. WMMD1102]|uniref:EAL domain-containing protein n=1 Tax=Micromonospora sp. WMMD1102 TaxID=3016105 RepID=UPI00241521FF|nr:EAL domain-containing protein [Micromonospora sp. WMMD1102]MDG4789224.1 EAL domain-containing protein [Micromonospora sp. WMMD1102]